MVYEWKHSHILDTADPFYMHSMLHYPFGGSHSSFRLLDQPTLFVLSGATPFERFFNEKALLRSMCF